MGRAGTVDPRREGGDEGGGSHSGAPELRCHQEGGRGPAPGPARGAPLPGRRPVLVALGLAGSLRCPRSTAGGLGTQGSRPLPVTRPGSSAPLRTCGGGAGPGAALPCPALPSPGGSPSSRKPDLLHPCRQGWPYGPGRAGQRCRRLRGSMWSPAEPPAAPHRRHPPLLLLLLTVSGGRADRWPPGERRAPRAGAARHPTVSWRCSALGRAVAALQVVSGGGGAALGPVPERVYGG